MATTTLYFPSREEPGEYGTDTPIHCADCNAQWDAEEDDGIEFERLNGEAYCSQRHFGGELNCYQKARQAAYRLEAASALIDGLQGILDELDNVSSDYDVELDDEPRAQVEALLDRARLFKTGAAPNFIPEAA